MRRFLFVFSVVFTALIAQAAPPASPSNWKAKVAEQMPLLGHRNWILVVDSAYPLQSSTGIETIETNSPQLEVVNYVLGAIHHSVHVRPLISMDAELPFVPESDAQGVTAYREQIGTILHGLPVESIVHEKIIANIDEASRQFHVLVLKTNMAIPYTSVFIRLDCRYWGADAEKRMREKMK